MTSKIQYSNRHGDGILAIGGDNAEEFFTNAGKIFGEENMEDFENALLKYLPGAAGNATNTAEAVSMVQSAMPGSSVIHQLPRLPIPGDLSPRESELHGKGFLPDKYRNWWHPNQFDQAPPCTCSPDKNRTKLALKVGKSKAGSEFTGWFCVNTFGARASNGCQAIFNKNYPEL